MRIQTKYNGKYFKKYLKNYLTTNYIYAIL